MQDTICTVSIKLLGRQKCVQCVVDADAFAEGELTEVVLTPQSSNFSNVGVEAFGVSMNSKSLSEPLVLCTLEDMLASSQLDAGETISNPTFPLIKATDGFSETFRLHFCEAVNGARTVPLQNSDQSYHWWAGISVVRPSRDS